MIEATWTPAGGPCDSCGITDGVRERLRLTLTNKKSELGYALPDLVFCSACRGTLELQIGRRVYPETLSVLQKSREVTQWLDAFRDFKPADITIGMLSDTLECGRGLTDDLDRVIARETAELLSGSEFTAHVAAGKEAGVL